MANGWTDDMGQNTQYDQFDPDEDDFQQRHWTEGYETLEGVQARHMENMIDEGKINASNYTIDNDNGLPRQKTSQELFMRDYGVYLGVIGVFLLFR